MKEKKNHFFCFCIYACTLFFSKLPRRLFLELFGVLRFSWTVRAREKMYGDARRATEVGTKIVKHK